MRTIIHPIIISFVLLFFTVQLAAQKTGNDGRPKKTIVYDAEDKGAVTSGNLSAGKFYRFSRKPDNIYPDTLPCHWSDGTKLTDEIIRVGQLLKEDAGVAWKGRSAIEIVVDLGRVQTLETVTVNGAIRPQFYALAPDKVTVFIRQTDKDKWKLFEGKNDLSIQKTVNVATFNVHIKGSETRSRYVKLVISPSAQKVKGTVMLVLDEISLFGKIKNTWRSVPANGCFHGAFPTSVAYTKEELAGRKGMVIDLFEQQVGKPLAMVLWYQGMAKGRNFSEIQQLREKYLKENYNGTRHLSVGWLPKELKPIAAGAYDDFFTAYFKDSVDPAVLKGMNDPVWIRPMNEFNGGWVPYGLDPATFVKAWRRMYNIAEQLGAAAHHIFVWSPNYLSFPDKDWNKMEKYYPGDQYVDWVGISSYPPGKKAARSEAMRYPFENIAEAYDKYACYKPFMISEGGFSADIDPVRWVKEWFEFKTKRPLVKAVIWENHNDRVISRSSEALKLYREMVQDEYWLAN